MKYIFLLLLLPFYVVSEEANPTNEIDTPVYIYRGGPYYSRGVLCRDPAGFHIRTFGPCPYYYHYLEHRFDFTTAPPSHELTEKLSTLKEKKDHYKFEALSGDANAQYFLASYYERGIRGPMDLSKAYAWFKISADNGHVASQRKLEDLIERIPPEVINEGEEQVFVLYEEIDSFDLQEETKAEPLPYDEIEDTMLFSQKNALK